MDKNKEAKEEKITSEKDIESILDKIKPRTKLQQAWWWVRYGIWNKLTDLQWQIPNVIGRMRRGWGHADVWGFDYYLADVIVGGLKQLKKTQHILPTWKQGEPEEVAQKRWNEIMDKIIWTFKTAQDIIEYDTMYIPIKDWTEEQYKKNLKFVEEMNKKHPDYKYKVLTKEECKKYEEGWDLFKTHFFSLWD